MKQLYLRNRLCVPVNGRNRAVILDLVRSDYFFIPITLYQMIKTNGIIDFEESKGCQIDNDWKKFLLKEEIIFKIENPEEKRMFPKVSNNYNSPNLLTNVLITQNMKTKFLRFFDSFYLLNISVIAMCYNPKKLNAFLSELTKLDVDSIYLYILEKNHCFSQQDFQQLKLPNQVLNIYTFNNPIFEKEIIQGKSTNANLIKLTYTFEEYSNFMVQSKLAVNYQHFFEAYNHHSYFNQKLYIDKEGFLKNGLNNKKKFGNINDINKETFIKIINSDNFKYLWKVKKQDTLVCKDCEFKFMCVDPRVPKQNKKGKWYHDIECNYNPYLSKWNHEENYKSLRATGVRVNEDGEIKIDRKVLKSAFISAWE